MATVEAMGPSTKRLSRPKITLQIPDATTPTLVRGPQTASSLYRLSPRYYKPPTTPGSHISDPHGNPYYNPFIHMYHNKASEFMFKQFEGFKDFTMNTAKSGLSAGEKSAFWFYNKLKLLSKKWFTHFFLTLCLALYTLIGAGIFAALEGEYKFAQYI
ncbi:hypothetical protein RR48_05489 [Papilio machaon]|uniref:TWiK family of potassium channels protein 18 n=1 Tax=Papilio machaon TaxID=76193 RepID=A0A0N1IPZ3_PAPMA|nr:hypothetical protein RR48_05489 [Papilio machaon]